jgi:transposase
LAREIRAMPSAVRLREDYSAEELRMLARRSKDVSQTRCLLSLAAVRDGMDRAAAAKIGGMDRQTLRDWVHRFNASGPEGLIDNRTEGRKPRLSAEQLAQFAKIVETGPDREKDGIVRWRRVDLKRVIAERFGVDFHQRYVGKLLKAAGYKWRKARLVLTSNDSKYSEKLAHVRLILSRLGPDEAFFSIDEFGPFAVKAKPGRVLAAPGEEPQVPQGQKSKGCLIITAALELSGNQVSHFYSTKKNTTEMIRMMDLLLDRYL